VENTYNVDYFETINKMAFVVEQGNNTSKLNHQEFLENEYDYTKTYTTDIVLNDAGDQTYDIIKERTNINGEQTTETLFEVMKHHNSKGYSVVFMDEIENFDNTYFIYEYSKYTDANKEFISVSARNQSSEETLNFYTLDYQKENEESFIVFYQSSLQGRGIPSEKNISYYLINDPISENSYYTNNKYTFQFLTTDFGQIVIQKRKVHFSLFEPINTKIYNLSFSNNIEFRYIGDWEHILTKKNLYEPQVIISPLNPFTLE